MHAKRAFACSIAACFVLLASYGCGDDVQVGQYFAREGSDGSAGNGGAGGAGGAPVCEPSTCQGKIYQCGDCLDNDADGFADWADADCLGPCDNTEDSFYAGIPGTSIPCRLDCYFDQDTGSGNDQCHWNHRCDPLSTVDGTGPSGDARCSYDPEAEIQGTDLTCVEAEVEQPAGCLEYCGPLTPNGCDCFGCCELPAGSGRFVFLGSLENGLGSCDVSNVEDDNLCRPCTPVRGCFNSCDGCEVCIGRPVPAPDCNPDASTGGGQCAPGVVACGPGGSCPEDEYCVTGCCAQLPR